MSSNTKVYVFCSCVIAWMLVVSCVHDSFNVVPPVPNEAMAKKSKVSMAELGRGYSLYQTQCSQCHELQMPKDMSAAQWHSMVPDMAWNAGLSSKDEKAVEAYITAASRQINPKQ